MSSLANAVKRRTHKERAQPSSRKKFGLLEKHKDYVLRAKDFHRKDQTLKILKAKAEQRNPDEFYFAMEKSRTKAGVHDGRLTKQNKYKQEELQLMKTQDVKYLTMKERHEAKKVKKLQARLHLVGVKPPERKHTVYVDTTSEARSFKPEEFFETPAELLDRAHNRPRESQLEVVDAPETSGREAGRRMKKLDKTKEGMYKALIQRVDRHDKLARTAAKMASDKEVMGKGRKRKVRAEDPGDGDEEEEGQAKQRVFKWKRERKK